MTEHNEELISRVTAAAVASVLRELGYDAPVAARAELPEWMPGREIRQSVLKVGKTKWNQVKRMPGFPEPRRIGRDDFYNVPKVRRFIAEHPDL